MTHFRVRIDLDNVRLRLCRTMAGGFGEAETEAWLARRGIVRRVPYSRLEFLASEESLESLEPWEILERWPLVSLPDTGLQPGQNTAQA